MASRKDYYDILGIRRGATEEEIEKAYQKLTRRYPFDSPLGSNKTAEAQFREISEAYEVLSNKEKREKYDRWGGSDLSFNDFGWLYDPEEGGEEDSSFEGFEDVIEIRLDKGERNVLRPPQKGGDFHRVVEIKFEEAIRGTVKEVRFDREISCFRCSGKGLDPAGPFRVCDECGGAGQIQIGLPPETFSRMCPRCHGGGRISIQRCESCAGRGRLLRKEFFSLQLAAGLNDGCRIYLKGMGQAGRNGGPAGDVIVNLEVQKHAYFERIGDDLHLDVPLAIWEAALGASVEVPTVDGWETVEIPQGTQNGDQLRIVGKGVACFLGEGRGDQVLTFRIILPPDLNEASRKILGELGRLNPQDPRRECGWRLEP